jgi:hypothetical protein
MLEFQSHFAPNVICILRAAIGVSEQVCFCERRRLQIDTRPSVITSHSDLEPGHAWQEIQWFALGSVLYVLRAILRSAQLLKVTLRRDDLMLRPPVPARSLADAGFRVPDLD